MTGKVKKALDVPLYEECRGCKGQGTTDGESECPMCEGEGYVEIGTSLLALEMARHACAVALEDLVVRGLHDTPTGRLLRDAVKELKSGKSLEEDKC